MKEYKIILNDEEIIELKKMFQTDNVDEAVRMAIDQVLKKQIYDQLLALKGNVKWEGNLEEMRETRI
ncbi:MAG TPA: hypothetical protein VIM29_00040 [Bacillota bacterium]